MTISKLEMEFDALWEKLYPEIDLDAEVSGLIPGRKFRFDYYHPGSKIAIEVNGGRYGTRDWITGQKRPSGHSSAKGLQRDYEKVSLAVAEGIYVFLLSGEMINEKWLSMIANTIKERSGEK